MPPEHGPPKAVPGGPGQKPRLIHGGMAQNVGPILNMVTSKYLLRGREEWLARQEALRIFDEVLAAVDAADVHALGHWTTQNWNGPLKGIIPWVSNAFTEIDHRARRRTCWARISGASSCSAECRAAAWHSSSPPSGTMSSRSRSWRS